jgi:hypothetical protein
MSDAKPMPEEKAGDGDKDELPSKDWSKSAVVLAWKIPPL